MVRRSDQKLQSIARKLEGIIKEDTAQRIYENLSSFMLSQKAYSETFDALSIIKLVIYIYSLKKTNDFKFAESILENMFFASLFSTNNKNYEKDCGNCDDGYISCYECDGTGNVECGECDGEGEITCEVCDGGELVECESCGGSGEDEEGNTCSDCNGDGQVKCSDCDGRGITSCYNCAGDGSVECRDCNGYGSENCPNCDGNGLIESDEIVYDVYEICSWDGSLYNILELRVHEEEPAISDDNLTKFYDSMIYLNQFEDHDEFVLDLEEDVFYCFGLETLKEMNSEESRFPIRGRNYGIKLNHYIGNYID